MRDLSTLGFVRQLQVRIYMIGLLCHLSTKPQDMRMREERKKWERKKESSQTEIDLHSTALKLRWLFMGWADHYGLQTSMST